MMHQQHRHISWHIQYWRADASIELSFCSVLVNLNTLGAGLRHIRTSISA